MKKAILVLLLAAATLTAAVIWILGKPGKADAQDILSISLVVTVVAFAVFIAVKKFISLKQGEPHEDELTRKVMLKTSSVSYYISLYMWLIIMYLSDKLEYETHVFIGAGIICMAVIFGLTWLFFNFRGIKNE